MTVRRNDPSRLLLSHCKDRGHRGSIARAAARVVESHDAHRIDEDIATELSRIPSRVPGKPAARELLRVGPPGPGSPDVPQISPMHPVVTVERAVAVDEDRPRDLRLRDVCASEGRGLERHHYDAGCQVLQRPLVLLQLQQVPTAGQSTEMPVKHDEEPMTPVIGEAVYASLRVWQLERNRRPGNLISLNGSCHLPPPVQPLWHQRTSPLVRARRAPAFICAARPRAETARRGQPSAATSSRVVSGAKIRPLSTSERNRSEIAQFRCAS